MRNFLRRHLDYTTRYHLRRRASSVDYRFLLAIIALAAAVFLAISYL